MKVKKLFSMKFLLILIIPLATGLFSTPERVQSADVFPSKLIYAGPGNACIEAPETAEVYYSVGEKKYNIKALLNETTCKDERTVNVGNGSSKKFTPSSGNCFYDIMYDWNGKSDKTIYIKVIVDKDFREYQIKLHRPVKFTAKFVGKASHVSSMFNDTSEYGYMLLYVNKQLITENEKIWIDSPFKDGVYYNNNTDYNATGTYTGFISMWEANDDFYEPLRLAAVTTGATLYVSVTSYNNIWVTDYGTETTANLWAYMGTAKVKVPKQAKAPSIKFNPQKLIFDTTSKQGFTVKIGSEDYTPWKDTTSKMTLYDIVNSVDSLTDNKPLPVINIMFRVQATAKKICSKSVEFEFPAQTVIDSAMIYFRGRLYENTKDFIEMQIIDCNSGTKPYEYCIGTPTPETNWTRVTKSIYSKISGLSEGSFLFIREAGTNRNNTKGINLKLPSTYIIYKVTNGVMVKQ